MKCARTPTSPPDVTAHLGYWLRYVSNHVSHSFARKVEGHGVTVAEWVLMRQLLTAETAAPSRLAERMGMTRGTISKLADRLVAKSLLVREASGTDGRAQTLSLSPAGRALVPRLAALADDNDAEFFDHLAPKDRAALFRIMKAVVTRRSLTVQPID